MATNSFELEDQTDEDFFDRLVNDDIDLTGYVHSAVQNNESVDEVKAFSKLSMSEAGPIGVDTGGNASFKVNGELGQEDGVVLEPLVPLQEPVVVKESESLVPDSKTEASALDDIADNRNGVAALEDKAGDRNEAKKLEERGEEGAIDGTVSTSTVSVEAGVKVVQWSSFNSDLNSSGDNSDFYSEFGNYSEDPFSNLGNTEKSWPKSNVTDSVLENSGLPFANLGNKDKAWAGSNVTNSVLENSVADLASSYGQHQDGQRHGAIEEQNLDGQDLNSSQNWENLYPGWRYDPNTQQWYQLEGYDVNASTNADVNINANAQESFNVNSSQNRQNLYPGWRYDPSTQQWYQLEGYDVNASTNADVNINGNVQESFNVNSQSADSVILSDQKADAYYLQQPAQSVSQIVAQGSETSCVSNWNQHSGGSTDYPAHMLFDPQYPGWYYDTIAQEWRQLESSTPALDQSTSMEYNHQYHNTAVENNGPQSLSIEQSVANWGGSMSTSGQQNAVMWQTQNVAKTDTVGFTEKQQYATQYLSTQHVTNSVNQQVGFSLQKNQQVGFSHSGSIALNEQASRGFDISSGVGGFESFNPAKNFSQHQNQVKEPNRVMQLSPANFDSQKSVHLPQQPVQNGTQFSHEASAGSSSAGRPPHALVTFGFSGKLIVMKDNSYYPANLTYGSQDSVGGVIHVLNLVEVVMDKTDAASFGIDGCDYFHALCQQSFPGPLVGGNVGSKELNKWIDDRITNYETPYMDFEIGDHSRLLFSLLKIACQYYGKLRSPFGTEVALKETDSPELAVAKLFTSAKRSNKNGALMLQNLPSEAQSQATALEVQKLLVSGRKKEALLCAQEGQLWGPALVIALQLGDQFYGDTVKHMALNHLAAGSPLRTLCLLLARQPADVFSNAVTDSSQPSFMHAQQHTQIGANNMLDEWEENLALLTANRTKDDELVIIHLGDCLWKERGQNTAAHICYLVAEANFEPYSDSARLCLVGADHWKFPRTYATPEAIQRTELYEYSMVLGNSQFLLLPFQPYKLIYAHMLVEVGKVADALKYCQAILKSLKYGRAPEVDTWRQLVASLEERIRGHQQGGYSTNSAPTKLMGKLLTLFDSTAHRVVGGLPPPVPSTSQGHVQRNEHAQQPGGPSVPYNQSTIAMSSFMPSAPSVTNSQSTMVMPSFMPSAPSVSNSQSTMVVSSLMPSASMEPITEWTADSNQLNMPNRSISEPDIGRSLREVDSSKKVDSSKTQEKASTSSGSSRFGFGSQILQKTLGFVKRSRQAKLGEKNKFYYDEKLKRWVEEGAEPPAEEAALPPPPPTAAFQNRMQDYNMNDALKTSSFDAVAGPQIKSLVSPEQNSGIPPMPPSSNQFSARGRTGVRSRYVDTFNKGGGTSGNLFQSPSLPSAKPGGGPSPKIFIPAPVTSYEETVQTPEESALEPLVTNNNPPKSFQDVFSTPQTSTSSPMSMQRFPSMDDIVQKRAGDLANGNEFVPQSRRVASWSGSLNHASNPSVRNEIKPLGETLGKSPLSHMRSGPPPMQFSGSGGSFGDLQEVEL